MRHRRFYIGIAILMIIGFVVLSFREDMVIGVERGYANISVDDRMNVLIASSINSSGVTYTQDGQTIGVADGTFYLSSDTMEWMVNVKELRNLLSCYVGVFPDQSVIIQKGDQRLQITNDKDKPILLNGNEPNYSRYYESGTRSIADQIYISAGLLKEAFGYALEYTAKDQTVTLAKTDSTDGRIFPAAYDYRTENRMPLVGDQGALGTCWAFASLKALESSFLPERTPEFSEDHLVYNNSSKIDISEGGRFSMAMAYLLAWQGPVLSETDPYNDGETALDAEAVYHVQNIRMPSSKDYDAIKRDVFLYGGVQSSIYLDMEESDLVSDYYNSENHAYCYIGTEKINHDVVIIGWDDNYSKENFTMELEGDGAFICMNSWGGGWGEQGCFYVSYYDTNIGIYNFVYSGVEDPDNYGKIYQTDLCGFTGAMGYGNDTAYFANVYTAEEAEELQAVGFYALAPNTSYEVYVEPANPNGYDRLDLKHILARGTLQEAGYYTILLDKVKQLEANEEFVVAVKIISPGTERPVAVEFATEDNVFTKNVDILDGQGYISAKGKYWSSAEHSQESNVCLKAYTIPYTPKAEEDPSDSSL